MLTLSVKKVIWFKSTFLEIYIDLQNGALVGTLATGWDEYETMFLETFLYDDSLPNGNPDDLPNGYWIGLKNDEYRKGQGKRWGWVDQWPMTYSRWNGLEPTGTSDCAFVKQEGLWGTETCTSMKPFVCKSEFYDKVPDYK